MCETMKKCASISINSFNKSSCLQGLLIQEMFSFYWKKKGGNEKKGTEKKSVVEKEIQLLCEMVMKISISKDLLLYVSPR